MFDIPEVMPERVSTGIAQLFDAICRVSLVFSFIRMGKNDAVENDEWKKVFVEVSPWRSSLINDRHKKADERRGRFIDIFQSCGQEFFNGFSRSVGVPLAVPHFSVSSICYYMAILMDLSSSEFVTSVEMIGRVNSIPFFLVAFFAEVKKNKLGRWTLCFRIASRSHGAQSRTAPCFRRQLKTRIEKKTKNKTKIIFCLTASNVLSWLPSGRVHGLSLTQIYLFL